MRRWLRRALACGLLAGLCWLPVGARAVEFTRHDEPAPAKPAERPPGPPAAVAILFTLVVIALVCLPFRKTPCRPPR